MDLLIGEIGGLGGKISFSFPHRQGRMCPAPILIHQAVEV